MVRYFQNKIFSNYSLKFVAPIRFIIKNLFPFFFNSGCKDNQMQMITKFNCKKFCVKTSPSPQTRSCGRLSLPTFFPSPP